MGSIWLYGEFMMSSKGIDLSRDGQFFGIKIKSECVNIVEMRPPAFHLWAKDREDLKRILSDKNIMIFEIDNIVEKGSDWDSIVK